MADEQIAPCPYCRGRCDISCDKDKIVYCPNPDCNYRAPAIRSRTQHNRLCERVRLGEAFEEGNK